MITDDVIKALKEYNLVECDEVGQVNKITAKGEMLLLMYGVAIANQVVELLFKLLDKDQKKWSFLLYTYI